MTTALYFAYGSNLDAEQLEQRCPSSRPLFRARLRDHRLDFTYFSSRWGGGAADVLPHSDAEVWGVVYALDGPDLRHLDRFERGYERVLLWVESDAGERHIVTSYTVRLKRNFRPTELYLEKMLRWGERWDLPAEYLARLRQVPVYRARGYGLR